MKNRKLFVTLVLAIALMLALAICSYAATITVYNGTDSTSEATTYSGSLTLPGNTEANDTVTVYYTDDGRAWKAGETVSFTEDTNLYTIECTKISSGKEWNNATGGGNYIVANDFDFHFANPDGTGTRHNEGGPINGNNCTTRVFMNGKRVRIGNQYMFEGNSQSFYLLGEGTIEPYWGRGIYLANCNNKNTDVVWLIGKDITITNGDGNSCLGMIYGNISSKSLQVHIYGKIIPTTNSKNTSCLISTDNASLAYDIYFHEGSEVVLGNSIFVHRQSNTTPEVASIHVDGGKLSLPSANFLLSDKSGNPYNGIITVSAGELNISNADALAKFKAGVVADKKVKELSATSFTVVCKECAFEKTLVGFTNLTSDFTISYNCPNCGSTGESTKVSAVFSTKGYSLSPDGKAISGGYSVSLDSLALYEGVAGKVTYGIVIANADSFEGKSFFDADNKVNSTKAIQVEINRQYSNFDCSINFGMTSNNTLKLVICAYVIDDGGVSFIQYDKGDSVASSAISGSSFKYITLDMIVANQPVETKENLI